MKNRNEILASSKLFRQMNASEIDSILHCLSAVESTYKKGEYLLSTGDSLSSIGLVLSGSIHIIKEDYWGNRTILSELKAGEIFGEAFACASPNSLSVNVVAISDCKILFLNVARLLSTCSSVCVYHSRLIQNLLFTLAEKNIILAGKIEHLSQRKLRDKLLSYLSEQSKKQRSASFTIPFSRQELADYLCVDRSALSSELGKLKKEGFLDYRKNQFTLY